MISLGDPRTSNPVLSSLQIKSEDRVISVKENSNADSNFVLTHLIKQILYEKNRLCFVVLHNTIGHYQNVGKKLGYDLSKAVEDGEAKIVEPLIDILECLDVGNFQERKEDLIRQLFLTIQSNIDQLWSGSDRSTYLIFDDLSHLLDLGVELSTVIDFVNYCINFVNRERISVILNTHVSSPVDSIVSNMLQYSADVHVEVSPLKTGRSSDVTGSMCVQREGTKNYYQFKTFDRGVKTFHPGESIYHLYK